MKHDVTPEERIGAGATDSPKKYTVLLPKDPSLCAGCPYPSVGFICWNPDGSCMKSDVEKINSRSRR